MVVVSAAAFVVGAVCLYYGARALRTKRAVRRLDERDDVLGDPTAWLDPPGEAVDSSADPDSASESRPDSGRRLDSSPDSVADPRTGVSVERGFVLLALGLLCLLFGFLAL